MNKNDIVLVDFPFSDLSQTKLRPSVIVATPGGQNYILCQITTKERTIYTYEVPLPRTSTSGDIRFDSNIYVEMIFTLPQSLIQKHLGNVKEEKTQRHIREKLQALIS